MTPIADCPPLALIESFLDPGQADDLLGQLLAEQQWPDNNYQVFGRQFTLPRLQTWHADEGVVYSYSNNLLKTQPWTPLLLGIKQRVEEATRHRFNAVLVNYYRDGRDYVGWHSDDEIEMGGVPVIVSLSLGAERWFAYRQKGTNSAWGGLTLPPGSLLLMQPEFQHHWQHSVPVSEEQAGGRINLTFRFVFPPAYSGDAQLKKLSVQSNNK